MHLAPMLTSKPTNRPGTRRHGAEYGPGADLGKPLADRGMPGEGAEGDADGSMGNSKARELVSHEHSEVGM